MSADADEVFAAYRFDGLDRWTARRATAWFRGRDVFAGYARHVLPTTEDPEIRAGLTAYADYPESAEIEEYISLLCHHLEGRRRRARS